MQVRENNLKKYIYLYVCVCVCVTESLFCVPETNTILQINSTSIKKKRKFKNKRDREASETEMNKMTQGEQRPVLRLFDRRPEHELQQHREKPIYRQEKALQSSLSLYFIKDSCDSRSFPSDCVWGPKSFLRGANCRFGENY